MDFDEKLTALKKAYADIILNTAKEAAARIMASQRKSVRLEHELNVRKENAVQMLVRLKLMMDLKISEAQTNSLSQQKKIEELEAQLQEAEDIVKELREELREVHDELDRVRNSHWKKKKPEITSSATINMEKSALDQISEVYNTYQEDIDGIDSEDIVEPDTAPIPEENRLNAVEVQGGVNKGCLDNCSPMGISNLSKPNLPSIILKSKGTEPYRNRRTQRIRAFEEKLMAGELTFFGTIDKVENDGNGKADEDGEDICKKAGPRANKMKGIMPAVQIVKSLKRKRGRLTRYKKNTISLSGHLSDQVLSGDRTSNISCGELNSDSNDVEPDDNPLDMLSRLSEDIKDESTLLNCTRVSDNDILPKTVGLQSGCAGVDIVDVPVLSSKEVTAGDLSYQPSNDKVFKYTFQRRNKQFLINSDSNVYAVSKFMNEKEVEVENKDDLMETENSASNAESSRDCRRVAQVARQLISLSEKRWWK